MSRKDNIDYHWMPNGDIRAYDRTAADKRGISERMVTRRGQHLPDAGLRKTAKRIDT